MKTRLILASVLTLACFAVNAQTTDAPGNNQANVNTSPTVVEGIGLVLGTIPVGTAGGTPVGLESNGSGNLLISDIGDAAVNDISRSTGLPIGFSFTATGNPIGVTTDGTNFYTTDTGNQQVVFYDAAGNQTSTFSVAAETSFPEGITLGSDGNLYVVNGSGGNAVHVYTTAGTLVTSFPILGSSPDGIAWDAARSVFWIYDSGTDTVRSYDTGFNEVDNFPGTIAAGFSGGEGLAVIGNSLFVVATGSNLIVEFGLAPVEVQIIGTPVPGLGTTGLMLLALMLVLGSVLVLRRNAG